MYVHTRFNRSNFVRSLLAGNEHVSVKAGHVFVWRVDTRCICVNFFINKQSRRGILCYLNHDRMSCHQPRNGGHDARHGNACCILIRAVRIVTLIPTEGHRLKY